MRQKVHLPQDSFWVKSRKNRAISTMQVVSSRTTRPPDPMMAPVFGMLSKSTGVSPSSAGMHPPEGPPIWTALKPRPPWMPPPILKTRSRIDVPMSTSARPPLTTFPARAKTFVPRLFSVPKAA